MTPVIDDTEAVPWEFLKTFLLKKKSIQCAEIPWRTAKTTLKRGKNQRPECPILRSLIADGVPVSALASRGGEGRDAPLRYPLLPLLPGKAGLQGLRHHSLEQRPRVTPLTGPKARAKCLIRHSQLHESKSFSIEDIFLSLFSAKKIACKPPKPSKSLTRNEFHLAF
jgi:hypothetical protein